MIAAIPLSWKVAIGAGLIATTLAGFWWAFREGKEAGLVDDLKTTIRIEEGIRDADARGPRTPDDVDRRLRDGSF